MLLLCRGRADERFVAALRIFNPDGSEAELSGNGAREAILYLRRQGWTDADEFSIETAAGRGDGRRSPRERTCRGRDGTRASLTSPDFPSGGPDGRGTLDAPAGASSSSSTSASATRSA